APCALRQIPRRQPRPAEPGVYSTNVAAVSPARFVGSGSLVPDPNRLHGGGPRLLSAAAAAGGQHRAPSTEPGSRRDIFVTGGAGFIGSNFLRLSVPRRPGDRFTNVDKLTYAANPANLDGIDAAANYALERVDIADAAAVDELFARLRPDLVVHFAAE